MSNSREIKALQIKATDVTYYHKELTEKIIACAIEVHRHLGPGLLESAYEECFCYELGLRGISFERQRPLPCRDQMR